MKKFLLLNLILFLTFFISYSEARSQDIGKRWALIIGIDKYPEAAGVKTPNHAQKDTQDVEKMFMEKWSVPKENIVTLHNEEATLTNIKKAITETLASKAGKDDYVFIYYSGYGENNFPDFNGDEKGGSDQCIVPYDCEEKYPKTYIIDDKFSQWLQQVQGKLVVIMDFDGGYGMVDFPANNGLEARTLAIGPFGTAGFNENSTLEHSVMTDYLINKTQDLYDEYQGNLQKHPAEAKPLNLGIILTQASTEMKKSLEEKTRGEMVLEGKLDAKTITILEK